MSEKHLKILKNINNALEEKLISKNEFFREVKDLCNEVAMVGFFKGVAVGVIFCTIFVIFSRLVNY